MSDLKNQVSALMKFLFSAPEQSPSTTPSSGNAAGAASQSQPSSTMVNASVVPVRETPVGTAVIKQDSEQAVMTVQAAIQFWCVTAPTACILSGFLLVPIGGMIGYNASFDSYGRLIGDIPTNIFVGCFVGALISIFSSFLAYAMTRPNVQVEVDKDFVKFGDYKFDRRFAGGLQPAYSSQETELKKSIIQPKFGVTALRFAYGPWGEDMKYMVDAHYVDDICIWMNGIIDSVGAPEPKENDAAQGRKVELL